MRKLNALPFAFLLLLAACGGGGGGGEGNSGSSGSPRGMVTLADTMITTATADDGEPWDVDVLAIVTTPEDEKTADL